MAVGARPFLIAYNINLATDRLDVAKHIEANLGTLPENSPGDGRGHGTFVAGIAAAASAATYASCAHSSATCSAATSTST